ncbi:uncharacterized protein [Cicer arietinum]|uniref:uncharacterized protein n=1 Tax=Cicer arietinum TaxID=3827 RepID=UPI003CC61573
MADPPLPKRTLGEELKEIHFAGRHNEDANRHLTSFFESCETVKVDGLFEEDKRMKLFPFSLTDDAKEWLHSFLADNITTWDDLEDKFLEQYFPLTMFVRKRQEIFSYKQKEGESLCDTYRRFKNLLAGCPNHAYVDTAQMQIFCNSLWPNTRIMLYATSGGSLNYKTATEAQKIIEIMVILKKDRRGYRH